MEKTVNEAKWYAVYTKPRWEKKIADLFGKKNIEHYCPLNEVYRQWSDRKKMVQEPLFKSYVFVRAAEKDFIPVLQTDGVINFVHWLGRPAIIKDIEIEAIKDFLEDFQNVHLEKTDVNINETVRIINGPLMAMEGNVVEVMNHSVKVLLPSLGFALVANVRKSHIEKVRVLVKDNRPDSSSFIKIRTRKIL